MTVINASDDPAGFIPAVFHCINPHQTNGFIFITQPEHKVAAQTYTNICSFSSSSSSFTLLSPAAPLALSVWRLSPKIFRVLNYDLVCMLRFLSTTPPKRFRANYTSINDYGTLIW